MTSTHSSSQEGSSESSYLLIPQAQITWGFSPSPCVALPQIHRIPKLPVRRVARLPRLHSLRNQLLLLKLPVQPHLLLQLPRKLPPPHQHKNPPPYLPNPIHNPTASAVLPPIRYLITSLRPYCVLSVSALSSDVASL